jgi:hypothetical protein
MVNIVDFSYIKEGAIYEKEDCITDQPDDGADIRARSMRRRQQ